MDDNNVADHGRRKLMAAIGCYTQLVKLEHGIYSTAFSTTPDITKLLVAHKYLKKNSRIVPLSPSKCYLCLFLLFQPRLFKINLLIFVLILILFFVIFVVFNVFTARVSEEILNSLRENVVGDQHTKLAGRVPRQHHIYTHVSGRNENSRQTDRQHAQRT